VHDFIFNEPELGQGPPGQESMMAALDHGRREHRATRMHGVKVHRQGIPFDLHAHHCQESTYSDYEDNICWICQNQAAEWDKWLVCGHMFCSECSDAMLSRHMPCPLCRKVSSVVIRGPAYPQHSGRCERSSAVLEEFPNLIRINGKLLAEVTGW